MSYQIGGELLNKIRKEEIIEEIYSADIAIAGAVAKFTVLKAKTVPNGYQGILMGMACVRTVNVDIYVRVEEKHQYDDGLNANGFPANLKERPLLLLVPEGKKLEVGYQATGAVSNFSWMFRLRLFKVGE